MVTAVRSSGSRQPSHKPSCNTPSSRTHRWSQRSSHKYNRTRKRGAGGGIVCVSFERPKMHSVHPAEGSGGKLIVDIQRLYAHDRGNECKRVFRQREFRSRIAATSSFQIG